MIPAIHSFELLCGCGKIYKRCNGRVSQSHETQTMEQFNGPPINISLGSITDVKLEIVFETFTDYENSCWGIYATHPATGREYHIYSHATKQYYRVSGYDITRRHPPGHRISVPSVCIDGDLVMVKNDADIFVWDVARAALDA